MAELDLDLDLDPPSKEVKEETSCDGSALNKLITDFKSSIIRKNIKLKGKIIFSFEDSSNIEVRIQPQQTSHAGPSASESSSTYIGPHEHLQARSLAEYTDPQYLQADKESALEHDSLKHKFETAFKNSTEVSVVDKNDFSQCSRQRSHVEHGCSGTDIRRSCMDSRICNNLDNCFEAKTTNLSLSSATTCCPQDSSVNTSSLLIDGRISSESEQDHIRKIQTTLSPPMSSLSRSLPSFENITQVKYPLNQQKDVSASEFDLSDREMKSRETPKDSSSGPWHQTYNAKKLESNTTLQLQSTLAVTNSGDSILSTSIAESSLSTGTFCSSSEMDQNNKTAQKISTFTRKQLQMKENDVLGYHSSASIKIENPLTFEGLKKSKISVRELENLGHSQLVALLAEALLRDNKKRGLSTHGHSCLSSHKSDCCQSEMRRSTKRKPRTNLRPATESDKRFMKMHLFERPEMRQASCKKNDSLVISEDVHDMAADVKSWKTPAGAQTRSNVTNSRTANLEKGGKKQLDKKYQPQSHTEPLLRLSRRKRKQADQLKSDNSTEKKSSSYSCKDCPNSFANKLVYRRHVRSHASGFQCDVCGKTLKTKDSLYHHQRGLHTKEKPYKCKQCHETFNFHHSFKLHIQRHKGERPHKCGTCNKTYLTSNHLKVHIEAAHEVGSIVCHICGKTFSYNCSLKQHLHKHTGERPYKCDKCDRSFSTKQSLRVHATSHLECRLYPCEVCGKTYKSEHSKSVHMKRHEKQVRKFMCELCGKAFPFKSTLKAHINIHSKARPYVCVKCGKAFKSKASLYTHKYVHRETQPFTCVVCGKAFKTKNCCTAHMKRHENEDTYSCSQCGSTFPDKGGLSKHVKTIHMPKKQFTCTICGKKGTRCDNMRTHVKSHRNGTAAIINPMEFIAEESITTDIAPGVVQARPRMRGPRKKNSRRLCQKDSNDEIRENDMPLDSKDIKKQIITTLQPDRIASKPENPPVSVLQSPFLNMPLLDQQPFNTQITFISNETNSQQGDLHSTLAVLEQERQQSHHQHQREHHYHNDHNKASYYLAYTHQQPDITGTSSSSAMSFGPMTSLLSAMNPSSDHDSFSGNTNSPAAYLSSSASLSMGHGNQQTLSGLYRPTEMLPVQGSLSQLHQILNRPNDIQEPVLLEHHIHSSSSNLQDHGHLDY